jgi:hypothetical protein
MQRGDGKDLRGNRAAAESGLPGGIDDIVSFVRRAIVFAELGDTDDEAAGLIVESDGDQSPDAVDAPQEVDIVCLDSLPLGLVMIFLLGGVTGVLDELAIVRCADDRHLAPSLEILAGHDVRLFRAV